MLGGIGNMPYGVLLLYFMIDCFGISSMIIYEFFG